MQQEAAASEQLQPWWYRLRWRAVSKGEARHAERLLLTHSNTSSLTASDVPIGPGKHDYMHTIVGGQTNVDSPQLVCIPGYGAGAAFMFRIFEGLSAGFRMFAVDLLGTGLSGRPAFKARSTTEAEDFFIDSFEKWRAATGVSGMVLVGHSLGGYLSAVYALKYPHHVKHLILVCPAGVGKRPADWQPPESLRSPWTVRGQLYRTAVKAWNGGVTPGSIIRGLGPWGKSLVEGYAQRRFKQGHRLNEDEVMAFQQYMYQILASKGSGEYALRHLLEPFAFPRKALEERLHELQVPVTFIYGDHDWMDPKAASRAIEAIQSHQPHREHGSPSDLRVLYTPNAGHYPFIDQPGVFLKQILETCGHLMPSHAISKVETAAKRHPYQPAPAAGDTKADLDEEMRTNPAAAEAHVATDM